MCGENEVVVNEQSSLKQQQQQLKDLDLNVKQCHKHCSNQQDKKGERKTTHQYCLPSLVQNDLL